MYGVKGNRCTGQDKSEQAGSARYWKKSKIEERCGKRLKKKKIKTVGRQKKLGTSAYWTTQVEIMLKQKQNSDKHKYDTVNQK